MLRTWVIGSGGLLGRAIGDELTQSGQWRFTLAPPFAWNDPTTLNKQFVTQIGQFFTHFQSGDQWQIIWAAGKSTMHSSESICLQETAILKDFLLHFGQALQINPYEGRFGFASTGGGIYTQTQDGPITESSPTSPSTPYARQKLAQEALLSKWASNCNACRCLILGRLSTLYGLSQDQSKKQGLISAITSCIRLDQPLSLFVPLQTKRDYLWAHDAAQILLWHLDQDVPIHQDSIRIIAQEESISIEAMLKEFHAITGALAQVSHSAQLPSGVYPLEVHFKSQYPITKSLFKKLSLREGIGKILANLPAAPTQ